jgi:hypothetical protein
MSQTDDLAARICALETVVSQLITHLAVRADDPAGWVQTRKALALSAINDQARPVPRIGLVRDALVGFFDQAESVAGDYAAVRGHATPRPFAR